MQQSFLNLNNGINSNKGIPLAYRARPDSVEGYQGFSELCDKYPFLSSASTIPSMIIWGPPGCGKTTLAELLAKLTGRNFISFSAVSSGVGELKKIISKISTFSIIFIDEIHGFNRSQQDILLPYVERGDFILIGSTTNNPKISLNSSLLSRLQIVYLEKFNRNSINAILKKVCKKFSFKIDNKLLDFISDFSSGDARVALNILEIVEKNSDKKREDIVKAVLANNRNYDKDRSRHFDVTSAFIKSIRGSDPSAALLWLAVMLDGGEDPVFIARRLVIFSSEDIGNADPMALTVATSTLSAVLHVGMPEARINLAQATTYLSSTVKSNASYIGVNRALEFVEKNPTIEVPPHLKNCSIERKNYNYPHNYDENFCYQKYTIDKIPEFYKPTEYGREKDLKKRLNSLWKDRSF